VITGKPVGKGGSEGRGTATAQGCFYAFEELNKELNLSSGSTVVIHGFGNTGLHMASIMHAAGYKIIAVADSKGGTVNLDGLDVPALIEFKNAGNSVDSFYGGEKTTSEKVLEVECDILAPAALENTITAENVDRIRTKVILELANGPTTTEADEVLFGKGVQVLPDILANAGGVTVSYFEWDQNLKGEHWTEQEVFNKLRSIMQESCASVFAMAKEKNTDLRTAAFIVAMKRIESAMKE
jgi:glutamate dehydrogenase/leucine dehydrogenase